jgi:hypothetical protein
MSILRHFTLALLLGVLSASAQANESTWQALAGGAVSSGEMIVVRPLAGSFQVVGRLSD